MANKNTRVPCTICKRMFFPQGMGVHMKVHTNGSPLPDLPGLMHNIDETKGGDEGDLAAETIMVPVKLTFLLKLIGESLRGIKP